MNFKPLFTKVFFHISHQHYPPNNVKSEGNENKYSDVVCIKLT